MYFRMGLGDQDKTWAPHSVCRSCVENLRVWTKEYKKKKKKELTFLSKGSRETQNNFDDCYFCLVNKKIAKNILNSHQPEDLTLTTMKHPFQSSLPYIVLKIKPINVHLKKKKLVRKIVISVIQFLIV